MRTSIHLVKGVLLVQYRCVNSLFIGRHTSSSGIYFFSLNLFASLYHHPNFYCGSSGEPMLMSFRSLNSFWCSLLPLSKQGFSPIFHLQI